jgi:SWI/SNF-related matrix-associated actin-dependent regulator of chromatin subfamily A3
MDVVDRSVVRITTCKHVFCQNCIEQVVNTSHTCPICRANLPSVERALVAAAEEGGEEEEDGDSLENMGESSSKLDALLHILEGTDRFPTSWGSVV